MNTLLSLITSLLLLLIATCIGRSLNRFLRVGDKSILERLVFEASVGLGVTSFVIFAIGIAGLYNPVGIFIFGLFSVCFGIVRLPGIVRDLLSLVRNIIGSCHSVVSLLAAVLLLVLALAALIPAFAPPAMGDWDSLAYHLSVPKLYLQHGGIYYINFTSHSNFPYLVEMLYLPSLCMHDPVGAKLMHYWIGILLIAAVALVIRKHFSANGAWLGAIAIAGMPIVLWEATTGYIDLATALYTVVCVHLLLNYFDTNDRRYIIACAISAGFAASTKMTGLAIIPLLMLWFVVDRYFSQKRRIEWKGALTFAGVALLVCSPWYIKSFVYTGNPVYPFFYSLFGGRDWTAALAQNYTMLQKKFGVGHDFGTFMFLPYDLTFHSERFYDRPGLYIGPLFLAAVPLLFVVRNWPRKLVGLLGFFAAQLGVWFMLSQQSRYLIPMFAVLAIIISAILYRDEKLKISRCAFAVVVTATALFGVLTLTPMIIDAAPVVFGQESRDKYLARSLDVYNADEWMNANLPKNAKIALYGDTRGFYLDRDYVWADPGHNAIFTRDFKSADNLVRYLKSNGITHMAINFGISFPSQEKAGGVAGLIYNAIDNGELQQIYPADNETGRMGVYKIR